MGCFLNSIVVLLLAPLLFALFEQGVLFFGAVPDWSAFRWVGLGILLYLPVYLLLSGRAIRFLGTLEHELCHVAMIYGSFGWVGGIFARADGNGGTAGSVSYFLVSLAPYFLPLFTLPLLPIRLFIAPAALPVIDILIGMTLAFHFFEVATRVWNCWQSDFDKAGPFALVIVPPAFTMIFLVLIAAAILKDYGLVLDYFRNVIAVTPGYYRAVLESGTQLAQRVVGLVL